MDNAKLRDLLSEYFNSSELHNLCFDLDIKHESIAGQTIEDKARELVTYCVRHGRIVELVNRCRELRPHVDWPDITSESIQSKPVPQQSPPPPHLIPSTTQYDPVSPIKIIGIIVDEITLPRNDGTRGSALYKVPLQLSREPSRDWADLFVETWNHPPRFTTKHRPGIVQVVNNRIILNGTTMQEIEDCHLDTLKLVLERVNKLAAEREAIRQKRAEEEARRIQEHVDEVKNIGERLRFD